MARASKEWKIQLSGERKKMCENRMGLCQFLTMAVGAQPDPPTHSTDPHTNISVTQGKCGQNTPPLCHLTNIQNRLHASLWEFSILQQCVCTWPRVIEIGAHTRPYQLPQTYPFPGGAGITKTSTLCLFEHSESTNQTAAQSEPCGSRWPGTTYKAFLSFVSSQLSCLMTPPCPQQCIL